MTAIALAEGRANIVVLLVMVLCLLHRLRKICLLILITARYKCKHYCVESKDDSKDFHVGEDKKTKPITNATDFAENSFSLYFEFATINFTAWRTSLLSEMR
jgi:hypothetical protein